MASTTAEESAKNIQPALPDTSTMATHIPHEISEEVFESPTESRNGSVRSRSSSSSSSYQTSKLSGFDGRSYSSTIRHSQEPYELFRPRIEKLCQSLWPPQKSFRHRFSNSQAVSRLRAIKCLRPLVPSLQTPVIQRLPGGDYNRIVGITLPPSYDIENRELILRVPRGDDGTTPDRAVAILNYVRKHTSIPVPMIAAKDFGRDNPLEKPYVIQNRLPGADLNRIWNDLNHPQRCAVAHELGGVMRTLLSLESPVTGILEATSKTTHTGDFSSIVPFELKLLGREIEGESVSLPSTNTPRDRQTTLDFFQTQFERWRADAVRGLQDFSTGNDVKLFDGMLKATREMADLGLFEPDLHCLCHIDLHMGNVMTKIQSDSTIRITAILDWDEAVFAPKFAACEPLSWLWGYTASDHVDEDEHLTWPYELAGANDTPSTPEQQELKRIFDEQAGPEYPHLAYAKISRLCRGLFRIATQGMPASHYYKAATRILKEWEVLRQSLIQ
jgi:aminoglycoside phosphotransferase (APT) family kinase protein